MAIPFWTIQLTDLQGVALGELLEASSRQVRIPIDRIATGNFTVHTTNKLLNTVAKLDQVMIKAYRTIPGNAPTPMCFGPALPSFQKTVNKDQHDAVINFADVGWRLGRRLIESSKSTAGVTYTNLDRGQMMFNIVTELNGATPPTGVGTAAMYTGVLPRTLTPSASTTIGPWIYKNALQGMLEIASTLDSPDWRIYPVEPSPDLTSGGTTWGRLDVVPVLGALRPDCVWEYGDGKRNVATFTQIGDGTGLMNRGYSLPTSYPNTTDGTTVQVWNDAAATQARGILYEDVVPSDLGPDAARLKLLQQAVFIQKQPKTVITFTPTVDQNPGVVPQYGVDYVEGDIVQFRAVEYGVETINALFRVYSITFNIDDNGNEIATPTLLSQDL